MEEYDRFNSEYDVDEYLEIILSTLGHSLLWQSKPEQAIELFAVSASKNPTSAEAFKSLAEAYLLNDQIDLAIVNYEQALDINLGDSIIQRVLKDMQNKN